MSFIILKSTGQVFYIMSLNWGFSGVLLMITGKHIVHLKADSQYFSK